jgi:hypothetical protein
MEAVYCQGMQVHYWPLNVCLEPPCDDYYLFQYHPDSHTCSLSSSFHVMVGIIIGLFLFAEFALNEVTIWISKRIALEVPPS